MNVRIQTLTQRTVQYDFIYDFHNPNHDLLEIYWELDLTICQGIKTLIFRLATLECCCSLKTQQITCNLVTSAPTRCWSIPPTRPRPRVGAQSSGSRRGRWPWDAGACLCSLVPPGKATVRFIDQWPGFSHAYLDVVNRGLCVHWLQRFSQQVEGALAALSETF